MQAKQERTGEILPSLAMPSHWFFITFPSSFSFLLPLCSDLLPYLSSSTSILLLFSRYTVVTLIPPPYIRYPPSRLNLD